MSHNRQIERHAASTSSSSSSSSSTTANVNVRSDTHTHTQTNTHLLTHAPSPPPVQTLVAPAAAASPPPSLVASTAAFFEQSASASSSAAHLFTPSGQPSARLLPQHQQRHRHQHQQHQPSSPPVLRSSPSHSALADSLRALRDHKSPAGSSTRSSLHPSPSYTSSNSTLSLAPSSPVDSLATRRKGAKPSPLKQQDLHSSNPPKLYGRQGLHSPLTPNSLQAFALPPLSDLPASPKERIEALLAHSPASPNKENLTFTPSPTRKGSESIVAQQSRLDGQPRKASLPSSLALMSLSPPASPASTITTTASPKPASVLAIMQRNSSIDSTVSTVSSTTTTSQPTRQGTWISKSAGEAEADFDPASFVAQSGSVEAALLTLWKDKQNATNHNAQLWRLVEKQRAVLLGLQKDMDKAFKEREKYRKKLKDHLASCPATQAPAASDAQQAPKDQKDQSAIAPVPAQEEHEGDISIDSVETAPLLEPVSELPLPEQSEPSPKTTVVTPKHPMHHYQDSETLGNTSQMVTETVEKRQTAIKIAHAAPSSPPISPLESSSDRTSLNGSPVSNSVEDERVLDRIGTPLTEPSLTAEISPIEKETPRAVVDTSSALGLAILAPTGVPMPPSSPSQVPTVALSDSTSFDSGVFPVPPKSTATTRKQVPAPLNLVQSNLADVDNKIRLNTLSPVVAVRGEDSFVPDSIERGRRRTRQDDDMVREAIAIQEEAARSASIKTKSKPSTPLVAMPVVPASRSPAIGMESTHSPAWVSPVAVSPAMRSPHAQIGSSTAPTVHTPVLVSFNARTPTVVSPTTLTPALVSPTARSASFVSSTAHTSEVASPIARSPTFVESTVVPSTLSSPRQAIFNGEDSVSSQVTLVPSPVKPSFQTTPPSPRLPSNMSALLMSPALSDSSTRANRNSMMVPFISPGLPLSPRPDHKPANSPVPRSPKQAAGLSIDIPAIKEEDDSADVLAQLARSRATPPPLSLPQIRPVEIARKRVSALPAPLFTKRPVAAPVSAAPIPEIVQRAAPPPPAVSVRQVQRSGSMDSSKSVLNIYKGYASVQYPDLLIAPTALPLVQVRVVSSRMRPSRNSILLSVEEDPVFLLGIFSRSDNKQLWRVEKNLQALPALHNQMKALCAFDGKLPDPSLFHGHAPAKIDARREALNAYFAAMLDAPKTEDAAVVLCGFFSMDALEPEKESSITIVDVVADKGGATKSKVLPTREGYLTKRGKNFGGWKARYFVLNGPELKYYDNPGGPQIGVIKLFGAQIGKQSSGRSSESPMGRGDDDNQYRHAFLVLEPKKRDTSSYMRHVLCAESDEERDAWVESCLSYVDVRAEQKRSQSASASQTGQPAAASSLNTSQSSSSLGESFRKNNSTPSPAPMPRPELNSRNISSSSNPSVARVDEYSRLHDEPTQTVGMSYESTVQAEAPMMGRGIGSGDAADNLSPSTMNFPKGTPNMGQKEFQISGPTNGTKISDMASWGLKAPASGTKTSAKEKKRSIFGFSSKARPGGDNTQDRMDGSAALERPVPTRSVFGMPLAEAVEMCPPFGLDVQLPAVVYRSIEYLRAMDAADEEGIFRLSGSNVTIKSLRERFTREGDVDLLDGEYCDIHAVASLLKLYLRELPQSILTRDLHMQFLNVNALDQPQKKVRAANVLVHKLPTANFFLLKALCGFLQEVVTRSDKNKMNVRNVGIVFAPTLNVAAWLISLLLTEFEGIFGDPYPEELSPIREVTIAAPEPSDPLRSPRQQVFTDLPTPTHNQTTFPSNVGGLQPLNSSPPNKNKIQSRTTYVPLGPQMHSQSGNRAQPAPIGPQHMQTQPHNEWAGPAPNQYQNSQQYMHRVQHPAFPHPAFPHPAALSAGQSQTTMQSSSQPSYAAMHSYNPNSHSQNGYDDSRRNRRESAMMGGDVGYIAKRPEQRQTLRDTNSSRLGPSTIF